MAGERMASVDAAWLRMDSPRDRMTIVGVKACGAVRAIDHAAIGARRAGA